MGGNVSIVGNIFPDIAIKAPCLVATTANITLSGVQTIDGVTIGNNYERVLVKDQTDAKQNGIYSAQSGVWQRTADAQKNTDLVPGTQVFVTRGLANLNNGWHVTTTDNPVLIGVSLITFSPAFIPAPSHFLTPQEFGAAADGTTDDGAAIQEAINACASAGGGIVFFPAATYATSIELLVSTSHVRLIGAGGSVWLWGPTTGATTIKWIGATDASKSVLKIQTPRGVGASSLAGSGVERMAFDGVGKAGFGLTIDTLYNANFEELYVSGATVAGYNFDCADATNNVNGTGNQLLRFRGCLARLFDTAAEQNAHGFWLKGSATGSFNSSLNNFQSCESITRNGSGIKLVDGDTNNFVSCFHYIDSGGTGFAIDIEGNSPTQGNDSNVFENCFWTSFKIRGTDEGFTSGTVANKIVNNDWSNAPSVPVLGTGCLVMSDGPWIDYTPTVTVGSGALGSYTPTGLYRFDGGTMEVEIQIDIPDNGTAATSIAASLPFINNGPPAILVGFERRSTGAILIGLVQPFDNEVVIFANGFAYPAASGTTLCLSGQFSVVPF